MPSPILLPLLRAGRAVLCAMAAAGSVQAAGPAAPPPPDLGRLQSPTTPARQAAAPQARAPERTVVATRPAATASASAGAASSAQVVVIEDRYNRIEEQHERGEVRRIQVQPKGGAAYEIVPATGGRDMSSGAQGGRGAAGQRVWPLLSF